MSKNKKQRARREAKDAIRKKAAQSIPPAANKPIAPTRASFSKSKSQSNSKPPPSNSNSNSNPKNQTPAKPKPQQASQKHDIPFGVYDRVLLVGEGDFSFTRSLCVEHGCAGVVGSSFDSEEDVKIKCVFLL